MRKKTAIVTGASSGFGLACTIDLAKKGFHVQATMRNMDKSEALLAAAREHNLIEQIEIHPLDVTSSDSIGHFKDHLVKHKTIDILVNNAGWALGGFCEEVPLEDYKGQFETNVFGVIAVTQAVLPFMRAQGFGRIINMSSISGLIGFPGLSPYVASKHALEGFSESLRLELKPFGIDVVLIEPGSYKTNIWASIDKTDVNPDSPYFFYMKALLEEIEGGKSGHGNPEDVAKLVGQIAIVEKSPAFRNPIGKGVRISLLLKNLLPWTVLEGLILRKLFSGRNEKASKF